MLRFDQSSNGSREHLLVAPCDDKLILVDAMFSINATSAGIVGLATRSGGNRADSTRSPDASRRAATSRRSSNRRDTATDHDVTGERRQLASVSDTAPRVDGCVDL